MYSHQNIQIKQTWGNIDNLIRLYTFRLLRVYNQILYGKGGVKKARDFDMPADAPFKAVLKNASRKDRILWQEHLVLSEEKSLREKPIDNSR